jgi:hypothetical protein
MVAGCAANPPPAPPPVDLNVAVPSITPQAETNSTQTKGGLQISIAPVEYTVETVDERTVQRVQAPAGAELMVGDHPDVQVYVQNRVKTFARGKPRRVAFQVTVNNQLPRVFHGSGTVVQFNVGGKLLAVDQRGYSDFQNSIIPPRNEQQITIYGPLLDQIPPQGIIGVFLYDVVTNQSDAGVVTDKQNFEWYFDYKMVNQTVQGHDSVTQGYMPTADYRAEIAREREAASGEQFHPSNPDAPAAPDYP